MGRLGDLLEAMHDAPRARTMHGRATHGRDHLKLNEAMLRWQDEQRAARGGLHQSAIFAMSRDVEPDFDPMNEPLEFWSSGDHWRIAQRGFGTINTADKSLSYQLGHGGVLDDRAFPVPRFGQFDAYFAPMSWLGSFRFEVIDDAPRIDRASWHARAIAARHDRPDRGATIMLGIPGGVLLDFELWVDQATGVITRCEGRLDDALVVRFEINELEIDEPIDPQVFALVTPDGSPVRTHNEMQLEHLRNLGADVDGIDPSDADAVQDAFRAHMIERAQSQQPGSPNMAMLAAQHIRMEPPDLDLLASQHTPTGPPPENEEDAVIDIGVAFQGFTKRSEDGSELVHVEGGTNLVPCVDELATRIPPAYRGGPGPAVQKVKFLNATEAVVWFTAGPLLGQEARAVFTDGAWKVSRATFCGMVGRLGVICPPPPGASD